MDALLSVDPGAIIWTIINFLVFFFIIAKFGGKAIKEGLVAREQKIHNEISDAEMANEKAKQFLAEAQTKIDNAQKEMTDIIAKGRKQAEENLQKTAEEAEAIKKKKIEEAVKEIENKKELAIQELRNEVAGLVIQATEKILEEKLDKDKHYKLVESYIEKIPKN
jgi:F-type H+-transporting ATPase subunit b